MTGPSAASSIAASGGRIIGFKATLLAVIYEAVCGKREGTRICTTWYWIVAIVVATAGVIGLHMI